MMADPNQAALQLATRPSRAGDGAAGPEALAVTVASSARVRERAAQGRMTVGGYSLAGRASPAISL